SNDRVCTAVVLQIRNIPLLQSGQTDQVRLLPAEKRTCRAAESSIIEVGQLLRGVCLPFRATRRSRLMKEFAAMPPRRFIGDVEPDIIREAVLFFYALLGVFGVQGSLLDSSTPVVLVDGHHELSAARHRHIPVLPQYILAPV